MFNSDSRTFWSTLCNFKNTLHIKLKLCTLVTNILGRKHVKSQGDLKNKKKSYVKNSRGAIFFESPCRTLHKASIWRYWKNVYSVKTKNSPSCGYAITEIICYSILRITVFFFQKFLFWWKKRIQNGIMAENSLAGLVNFISKISKSEWESSKWLTSEFVRKTTIAGGYLCKKKVLGMCVPQGSVFKLPSHFPKSL